MNYFEDVAIGEVMALGGHTFTAEEIKAFALRFDPQPFHTDEAAAKESHFGALCASGWHTSVVWMRLMVEYRRRLSEAARARGEPVAAIGPALGFRDLKWHKPVYVNDTISYQSEVVDKRPSRSRPRLGLVSIRSSGVNQHGELVLSFVSTTFLERRPEVP
ncbi:MAG TPA: MaoC family dehydratase [Pseudolabrys sp.]|jgi:acyl dehydratase|nr:MaoC family dehydratase [Pseudolabrys sp.]